MTSSTPPPLLVVAHGDGGADPRDEAVARLAERLARRRAAPVVWATLKRPESFEAARAALLAALRLPPDAPLPPVDVYPFFMAEGFFVRTKLPKVLAEHRFETTRILPVFGLDPRLVDLLEHRLRALASLLGFGAPADARIVLVAHGSASGDAGSRLSSEAIAATLAARLSAHVGLAFVEEEPFFDRLIPQEEPDVVIGLFVSAGTHALDDVATVVAKTASVRRHVAAIGEDAGVADVVEAAIAATRPLPGA